MRSRGAFLSLMAAACSVAVAPVAEANAAFQKRFAVLDTGTRFVQIVGEPGYNLDLPTPAAMGQRFRDGDVRYNAKDAIIFDDPSLADHKAAVQEMIVQMLAHYTKGPKPSASSIRFKIDYASDVNCMVVPVNKEQYSSVVSTVANTVFDPDLYLIGKPAQTQVVAKTNLKKQFKKLQDQRPQTTQPSQIELRCTSQAMKQLGASNEMAFIVAHELSHILLGHWERNDAMIRQQQHMDSMLVDGASFIVAARSDYKFVNGEIVSTPHSAEIDQDLNKLMTTTFLLNEYNLVIQGPEWAREQEREADLLALDLMYGAGIKRNEAHQIMDKFDKAEKEVKKNDSFVQRLVQSVTADLLLSLQQSNIAIIDIMKRTGSRAGWAIISFWRNRTMTRFHDDYTDRAAAIIYYESKHPDVSDAVADKASAQAYMGRDIFKTRPIRDVLEPMETAMSNMESINGSGCASLIPERLGRINEMLSRSKAPEPPRKSKGGKSGKTSAASLITSGKSLSQAENMMLASYLQVCKADVKAAIPYAKAAAEGSEKQATLYIAYIQLLMTDKNFSEALSVIDKAETAAPPYTLYIVPKIQATYQLGKRDEALKLALVCRDFNMDNLPLATTCMNSAGLNLDGSVVSDSAKKDEGKPGLSGLWDKYGFGI